MDMVRSMSGKKSHIKSSCTGPAGGGGGNNAAELFLSRVLAAGVRGTGRIQELFVWSWKFKISLV